MNARRLAEIEEMFDTVPEPQFQAERKLRAAQAENAKLRAALEAITDMEVARDAFQGRDQFVRAHMLAAQALERQAGK